MRGKETDQIRPENENKVDDQMATNVNMYGQMAKYCFFYGLNR